MFLEELDKERKESAVITNIKTSVSIIQGERDRIGMEIEKLVDQNLFSNKEIVDKILEETTLSKNMVHGILEEYNFNKLYPNPTEKINIKDIVKIKKYFKDNDCSEEEKKSLLNGNLDKLKSNAEIGYNQNKYKHQIVLEEDTQNLYLECKEIVEKELGRPIKSKSELFTLIMSDFYVNNSDNYTR